MNHSLFMSGLAFGLAIGITVTGFLVKYGWQDEVIKHQCAEYNSTTGDFQWLYKEK